MTPQSIGKQVQAARKAKGWEIIDLSFWTSIEPQMLHKIEADEIKIGARRIRKLNQQLGLHIPIPKTEPKQLSAKRVKVREQKSERVLAVIREYMQTRYCLPTLRQIMEMAKVSSTSMVVYHIQLLIGSGRLVPLRGHHSVSQSAYQLPEVVNAIKEIQWSKEHE